MMDYQIDYYKYLFKDYIEFVSLNGPYQCSKKIVDPEISSKFSGPYFAWYTFDPESKQVKNYIESLEYVIDFINKNGPFDGILAYSQGINISRVLIKLEKLGSEYPKIPFEKPKFAVFFGSSLLKADYTDNVNPIPQSWREDFDVPILY